MQLKSFSNTDIPVFFSEYGCNLGACGSRLFQETTAIFSPAMTSVFSGGIAYEFYDSPDIQSSHWGFGLVRPENTPVGRGLTKLPDYHSLKSRLEASEEVLSKLPWHTPGSERSSVAVHETPPLSSHWQAGHALPYSLADWGQVQRKVDEKLWVEVEIEPVGDTRFDSQPRVIRA